MNQKRKSKKDPSMSSTSVTSRSVLVLSEQYLSEVRKYPLLKREEEQVYAKLWYEEGDKAAANVLVTSNLRLVVKVAMEYQRRTYANLLDLIQEGNMGLMHAVRKFDPYKGVRLISYAVWWIRAYIQKFLSDNKSLIKKTLPSAQISLDALPDDSDRPVLQIKSNDPAADTELIRKETQGIFQSLINEFKGTLNQKDMYIFEKRVTSDEPLTLQQIGNYFGFTRERARQLESRLMRNFKHFLHINRFNGLSDETPAV